jgi:hypothetical protein
MSNNTDDPSQANDGEPSNPPAKPQSPGRYLFPILISLLIVLTITGALVWWFLLRDDRPDVWEETTVPYTEDACEEEGACEVYAQALGGHGAHDGEGLFEFSYNPAIDDPIAQWGDCLDSVFTCISAGMDAAAARGADADRVTLINGCVAQAECPGECKDRFASRAAGEDFEGLEAVFFDMFVDERGYCVPREADQ